MSSKQKFIVCILGFVLLLVTVVGGYAYGVTNNIKEVLQAPAATGKINIDADMWFEASKDGKLELQSIHLNRIEGEFNSKILDLLLIYLEANR